MSGTRTIEAIAVGTRRSGRSLTLRMQDHEMDELIIPTQPREWQSSLRESFSNPLAFKLLIEDMRRLDSEFTDSINSEPTDYTPSSSTLRSNILKYQEYVDAFVAIFAKVSNKDVEGDHIIDALKSQRCPKLDVFRRLVINPNFIVNDDLDNSEVAEMIDSENKKVPVTQLARMCDVAVLNYLGNVTERTPPSAIVWALGYISYMTNRIGDSLRTHSESGWYGLSFHKRKSTIRNSSTEVPKLALDGQLLVIGVGLSEPVVSPETGQGQSNVLPSIAISEHGSNTFRSFDSISSIRSGVSEVSLHVDLSHAEDRTSPVPSLPELRIFGTHSPVGHSLEEMQVGAKKRRHSVASKPPVIQSYLPTMDMSTRRSSFDSKTPPITNPIYPKRKTSIVEPVKAIIESIVEERQEEQLANSHASPHRTGLSPVLPHNPIIASSLESPHRAGLSPVLPHNPIIASSLESPHRAGISPVLPHNPMIAPSLESPHCAGISPVLPHNPMIASSLDRPMSRSPSPLVQSLTQPTYSPPPDSSDTEQSDDQIDSDADVSTTYTHKPRATQYTGPPALSVYTTETRQTELHTLITHNGRISLLAILNTISKLPSNPQLWTEDNWDACKVCIFLIQFCVDFGLDTHKKNENDDLKNAPFHRQRCLRSDPRVEKPSTIYSKLILKYAVKALIHCAVSTYTGCLIDKCRVNTYCTRNASQNLNKMMHQLERLYSNSPLLFRESMMEFANNVPLQRVFHFLHVILQYCPRGSGRDPLDPSSSRRDPLIVLSATVLRIVIDRMVLMNLNEPMIKHSVVREAMAFIHFSYTLFNQEFLRTKGFAHLQWYVNRIALSIVLPVRQPINTTSVASGLTLADDVTSGTFPRQSKKKKNPSMDASEDSQNSQRRKRGQTVNYPNTSMDSSHGNSSPLPSHKVLPSSRKKLVKQMSVHSDSDTLQSDNNDDRIMQELQSEWHGLHLGVLHQRIRRLSVMMDLTEPGVLPDASLLGSLISVGPAGSLVPRALVLLECALFVNKLSNEETTLWMKNQTVKYTGNWDLFKTFKSWGEAIGEALSACEITEKELFSNGNSDPDNNNFAEEPVLNDEEQDPEKRYIVNHSLKMVACALLIEITKFLREPPPTFLPVSMPALNRSFSSQSQERKPSNISIMSSDSDTNPSPTPGSIHQTRQGSLDHYRKGSSPLLEDVPRFPSSDHPPSPNTSSRVSMYLRVNSRHGKKHPRPQSHTIQGAARGKSHQAQVEIPAESFRVVSSNTPLKATRRMSVSAAAFLNQNQVNTDSSGTSIRHRARPSVSIHPSVLRRKSVSGSVLKSSVARRDNSPILSRTEVTSKGVQAIITPPNTSRYNSPQSARRRPSVLGRVLQQGRKIAQRRRPVPDSSKPRASTTTNTSSAASSPGLGHHRTMSQTRANDVLYDSTLEDIKSHFPWLDVIEHMIVSFYSTSTELQDRRKKSCCQLMAALEKMYSLKFEQDEKDTEPMIPQPSPAAQSQPLIEASITTAFTTATLIPGVTPCDKTDTPRTMGSIIRPAKPAPAPAPAPADNMPRILGKLDFSGVRLRRFLESGMSWGSKLDGNVALKDIFCNNDDEEMLHASIDYLLETDSSQSLLGVLDSYNSVRLKYISTFFAGLLHAPFSLLTYAAPVLPSSTFRDLQESAWIALCDRDYEYADAAASFFLLCCVKEKEKMYSFLKAKAKTNHPVAIRDAVTRFDILWRCRDGVWSRMEQSAPKLFKLDEETSDTIGYCLPSQLLGVPGENLPYAPWKPISVCTCDHSKENVQCYQGTKHAPLEHLNNIVKSTRVFPVSGSSIIQMDVDTTPAVINSNALLELDREEYEQGIFKIKDVYKLSTLFPNDLLPLIILVIKALDPPHSYTGVLLKADGDTNIPSITQISSMAERLLWHSMLDNPYYLFYPLLNQFNVLYKVIKDNKRKPKLTVEDSAAELLEGILKPFHTLLSHYPHLPPKASHMLFNNFIGIIMRHTEQPVVMSDVIIHSVLTLLRMVVPSIKGLTMKELKNQLKKESCYTTILTTARIRGVEKIKLAYSDQPDAVPKDIPVQESMKFFEVIDAEHTSDNEEANPFSSLYSYYLTEEKKTNRTILNSLVIQDHYPATADGSVPTFTLHKSSTTKHAMKEQEDLLYIHKMTELARVMFTIEMLTVDISSNGLQQEFAQPNPSFVLSELQGLNSFPRKTLSSLPDEVGLSGLHEWHLRMIDTMLRGVWSKFILKLFIRVNDYQPNDSVVLFLTVINGSLLLQAEDSSTLRYSLASLLVAATKFDSIFRQNAYQMIVPMLLRVYSLHSRNKMVKDAIKFVWACFYGLGRNTFLLQAIVSVANLFSSEVATIATNMKVNYCPLCIDWQAEEQTTIVKSVVELIETLDCTHDNLPVDKLDILGACPVDVRLAVTFTAQSWSACSLEQVVPFCVTVASFNPEVLRGMQVLVFLDFVMIQLIKEYVKKKNFHQIICSIRSLIKGCESLKRSIKTNVVSSSKGTQLPGSYIDDQDNSTNQSKLHIRQLFFKNHSATSQSLNLLSRDRSVSELPAEEQRAKLFDGFRNRSLQNINQQIVTLSRNSLLSIASQLISHTPSDDSTIAKNPFDSYSLMNICSITEKVLRSVSKSNQDSFLDSKGIIAVFNNLLPNVIWDAENISSFYLLLDRVFKIFRKLQTEYCQSVSVVPWSDLIKFITSLQQCVYNCPSLIDNDQILVKFKAILEICLSTKTSSIIPQSKKRNSHFFIQDAPNEFISSFIELCAEMIIRTRSQNIKHRVLLSGLFESSLDFKIGDYSSVWEKMFLLLSVTLGIRDSSCISEVDIFFIMENVAKMAEHVQVVLQHVKASSQKDQIRRYFNSMRILLTAYSDNFSQEQWIIIGYSLLGLTSKFDASTVNELYFEFCSAFLDFWDLFVLPCRLPIFSIAWHVIGIIESQLSIIKKNNMFQDQADLLDACLENCQVLLQQRSLLYVSISKRELLYDLQEETLFDSNFERDSFPKRFSAAGSPLDTERCVANDNAQQYSWSQSHTSLKRRNSKAPNFPAIDETSEVDTTLSSPDHLGRKDEQPLIEPSTTPTAPPLRPTSLAFKPSIDKLDMKAGSPKLMKNKPAVSFSDKTNERSPSSKKFFSSSLSKQTKPSPIAEKPKKTSFKHRMAHTERLIKDKTESGFEADEEDASLETPRSSVSYPSVPGFKLSPTKKSPISSHVMMADIGNLLTVSAEIHGTETSSLTSNESNHDCNTSFSSDDDVPIMLSKVTKQTKEETKTTNKSPDLTKEEGTKSYHNSPPKNKRHMFKMAHAKNGHVEEPDEQTGQINHDQQRNRYFETKLNQQSDLSHRPRSFTAPRIEKRSEKFGVATTPKDERRGVATTPKTDRRGVATLPKTDKKGAATTPKADRRGVATTPRTDKRGVTTTPKTGKKDASVRQSRLYDISLKQADGFLGHDIGKWPPDDDCSV